MADNGKITKRDCYNTLRNLVENTMFAEDAEIGADKLLEFIDHEVELMTQRAEKSKKYQKEHKATNDAMTDAIYATLSDTPMTVADIVDKVTDATPQKVVYRLGQLFKNGYIAKDTQTVKAEGAPSRRVTYYTAISPATTAM